MDISDQIISTFESNLLDLPAKNQLHWSLRMWRITGDEKYIGVILTNFQIKTLWALPKITRALGDPEYFKATSQEMVSRYRPQSDRKKRRVEVYQAQPERLFLMQIIHYLFVAKSLGFTKLAYFKEVFEKAKVFLRNFDLEALFLEEKLVRLDPSAVANTIYYLEFLDILKIQDKLLAFYQGLWLNYEPKDDIVWKDKVYALTHLIIAGSYFYQRTLAKDKFSWILNFFETNLETIKAKTNEDIVGEVGLCFKICRDEDRALLTATDFITSKFSAKGGFIPREKNDSLAAAEHRNIIAVMLLREWAQLRAGPDIPKYLKDSKKGFYIPESGQFIGFEEPEEP